MRTQSGLRSGQLHDNATCTTTVDQLHSIFATHGKPEMLVTNGTVITSDEFNIFTEQNGISLVKSAPYHPASNGPNLQGFYEKDKR